MKKYSYFPLFSSFFAILYALWVIISGLTTGNEDILISLNRCYVYIICFGSIFIITVTLKKIKRDRVATYKASGLVRFFVFLGGLFIILVSIFYFFAFGYLNLDGLNALPHLFPSIVGFLMCRYSIFGDSSLESRNSLRISYIAENSVLIFFIVMDVAFIIAILVNSFLIAESPIIREISIVLAFSVGCIYQYMWFKNRGARNVFLAFFVPMVIVIPGFFLAEIMIVPTESDITTPATSENNRGEMPKKRMSEDSATDGENIDAGNNGVIHVNKNFDNNKDESGLMQKIDVYFSKDDKNVYFIDPYSSKKKIIDNVDVKTFVQSDKCKSLEMAVNYYYKDKNRIYRPEELLTNKYYDDKSIIDYETYEYLGFVQSEPGTMPYGNAYVKDKNHIYYACGDILKGVDKDTFEIVGNGFVKDKDTVYKWDKPIKGVNPNDCTVTTIEKCEL